MINIAEILKDYPKGTKLYSPLCGECELHMIDNDTITCSFSKNLYHISFDIYGHYNVPAYKNSECLLFPSKENRDWSTFQRPFKDGDVVVSERDDIHLLRTADSSYCTYRVSWGESPQFDSSITTGVKVVRFATEEEKQKLFDAIKANGYKWNAETKTLEKKKKEYPKTYEECCVALEYIPHTDDIIGYKWDILQSFQKLLICRDAYWKIAGEEMGLGKPWEPNRHGEDKYTIEYYDGVIIRASSLLDNRILAFPTAEMRDAFCENFKELIEQCKELL